MYFMYHQQDSLRFRVANLTERNAVLTGKNKALTEKVTEIRDKFNNTNEENEVLRGISKGGKWD